MQLADTNQCTSFFMKSCKNFAIWLCTWVTCSFSGHRWTPAATGLHFLACLLRHCVSADNHSSADGKIHAQVHSFSYWWFILGMSLQIFSYNFEMLHRATQKLFWFQIWQQVLQSFCADSSGTAIHLSYYELEELFITQQSQLISILDTISHKFLHLILIVAWLFFFFLPL